MKSWLGWLGDACYERKLEQLQFLLHHLKCYPAIESTKSMWSHMLTASMARSTFSMGRPGNKKYPSYKHILPQNPIRNWGPTHGLVMPCPLGRKLENCDQHWLPVLHRHGAAASVHLSVWCTHVFRKAVGTYCHIEIALHCVAGSNFSHN